MEGLNSLGSLRARVVEDLGWGGEEWVREDEGEESVSKTVRGKYKVGNSLNFSFKATQLISLSPRFLMLRVSGF